MEKIVSSTITFCCQAHREDPFAQRFVLCAESEVVGVRVAGGGLTLGQLG
jgi:hypothetical protein